jgi:hypothetical protein
MNNDHILDVFNDIRAVLDDVPCHVVDIIFGEEPRIALMSTMFLLIGKAENEYLLSFSINNCKIVDIARLTNVLTVLLGNTLHIHDDNYIDVGTGEFAFGDDAYCNYEADMFKSKGYKFCVCCENYLPKEVFEGGELCSICSKITIPATVFS